MLPEELDIADRAVSLLGDDDLRLAANAFPILVVGLVILLAVDEHHHVGILLDGARFAEVVEPRAVVTGGFRLPIQLSEAQHRDIEFARHPLEPPRDSCHLFLPRVAGIVGLDQLEVVDHDQRESLLTLEPPCHRCNLGECAAGRIVDEQRGGADLRRLLHQPAAILLGDRAVSEPMTVDL